MSNVFSTVVLIGDTVTDKDKGYTEGNMRHDVDYRDDSNGWRTSVRVSDRGVEIIYYVRLITMRSRSLCHVSFDRIWMHGSSLRNETVVEWKA